MSFRREEKISCTKSEKQQILSSLKKQGMLPLHPARVIRSTYYDNVHLGCFHDSEEGVLPRKKIRIRNYPNEKSGFTLETKISSVEGRFKEARAIAPSRAKMLVSNGLIDCSYGLCRPMVVVEYERTYFTLGGIRITFDQNIRYSSTKRAFLYRDPLCVVELKAPMAVGNDYLSELVTVSRSRFSKYSRAVAFTCK